MEPAAKLLVVDDNEQNLTLLHVILRRYGYDIRLSRSGEEALQQIVEDPPDLIILDVMMPLVDGFEVCKLLKDNPATRLIPVVMMTVLDGVEDRIKGIDAGADDFLTKPVNRDELLARIRTSLRLKWAIDTTLASRRQESPQHPLAAASHDFRQEGRLLDANLSRDGLPPQGCQGPALSCLSPGSAWCGMPCRSTGDRSRSPPGDP
jgi:DNA-binding response OmpR family regulator